MIPGEMTAVILAAGVARRLAPLTDHTQKSLLPVGDRPILARMLDALAVVGVRRVVIVVGHCADQVEALARGAPAGVDVQCLHNEAFQKGSALSLYTARELIAREPTLIMDADVVFPRELLRRLVDSAAPNALLVDRGFADTGEEVKIYTRQRACHRARQEGGARGLGCRRAKASASSSAERRPGASW